MLVFTIRVNLALARLGIAPNVLNAGYKAGLIAFGKTSGNSPQEIAVYAAAQLPIVYRLHLNVGLIKTWARKRKINPQSEEMREALLKLDLWGIE